VAGTAIVLHEISQLVLACAIDFCFSRISDGYLRYQQCEAEAQSAD
jgi:hypothetical protein